MKKPITGDRLSVQFDFFPYKFFPRSYCCKRNTSVISDTSPGKFSITIVCNTTRRIAAVPVPRYSLVKARDTTTLRFPSLFLTAKPRYSAVFKRNN